MLPIVLRPEEPRYFGLGSPPFVLSIAVGVIVLGIVLVVMDAVVPGVIAIVAGVCLIPSFLAGLRRWPKTPLARASLSTARRVRGEAGAAVESISTWSKAGRDLARHRRQQFRLRRERDAKIRELGVSAYAEDGRADELKAAAKELDSRIEANEQTMQQTIAGARRRVRKERAAGVVTEVIPAAPDEDEDEAPKT